MAMLSVRAALAVTVAATILLIGCAGHASDDSLRSRFFRHENSFRKLIQMANEDSHVIRICPTFTWLDTDSSWPRSNIGFSEQRWNVYRELFRDLGLDGGVWRSEGYPGVMLIVSATGMVGRGTTKGYVFSTRPLEPVIESLDDQRQLPCAGKKDCMVYKRLNEQWYIFYEIG